MKREDMRKALREAISEVMETMFFQPVNIKESGCTLSEWLTGGEPLVTVSLSFFGPLDGALFFLVPSRLANGITSNFLNLSEDEITDLQRGDTVKESLNMILGDMLSRVEKRAAFKLGLPHLLEEKVPDYFEGVEGENVLIETEDNRLALRMVVY